MTTDRRKFLQRALAATVFAAGSRTVLGKLIPVLGGDSVHAMGTYSIDISQSPYTALQTVGGSVVVTILNDTQVPAVILTRVSATTFDAVSDTCTHAGCALPA